MIRFFHRLLFWSLASVLLWGQPAWATSKVGGLVAPPSASSQMLPFARLKAPATLLEMVIPSAREAELKATALSLGVPYAILARGMQGLNLLYGRDYAAARALFQDLADSHEDSVVGPFGLVLLAQVKMSENLDFSEDEAFESAYEEAFKRAKAALSADRAPAWNSFLRGCLLGVNSMYYYRKDKVIQAVRDGWRGLGDLERAKELAPTFMDPDMGLGLYNYWRSAVTRKYDYLPKFPDLRKEGITQMIAARDHGVFAPVLARLALIYSYINYHKNKEALAIAIELQQAYPDNVLNLQLLGILYARRGKIKLAKAAFTRVIEVEPGIRQVYYYIGRLDLRRGGDPALARDHLKTFLARNPEDYYRTLGHVRLGDAYWLLDEAALAEAEWALANEAHPEFAVVKMRMKGVRPRKQYTKANIAERRAKDAALRETRRRQRLERVRQERVQRDQAKEAAEVPGSEADAKPPPPREQGGETR